MRIVHLASGREWRGGQRQTLLLAEGLARRTDVRQIVVTRRGGELARRLTAAGVDVAGVPWALGVDPRAAFAAFRLTGAGDVLHAHDAHAVAIGAVVARSRGVPLVAARRVALPLRRAGVWRRADRVIAVSRAVEQMLRADGIPASRIVVVPSGVDVAAIRQVGPVDPAARLALPPESVYAVCVAALTREKGHDTLIAAAAVTRASQPHLHWLLLGDGPLRSHLEGLVRAGGLAGFVHFLGAVDDPLPWIAGAHILVLPSRTEGYGTAVLEAMALGVPVVASRVGGVPEVLADGGGVMIPPDAPDALAREVVHLLTDSLLRERVVREGSQAVDARDASRMVESTLAVYRSLREVITGQ